MRRSASFNLSWQARESFTPCSNSSRLFSKGRSPRSSSRTMRSSSSSELSKFWLVSFMARSVLLTLPSLTVGLLTRLLWRRCRGLQILQLANDLILQLRPALRQALLRGVGDDFCQPIIFD